MTDEQIGIISSVLGKYIPTKSGTELNFSCPFCGHHKQKLAINKNTGAWHCWVCEKSGGKPDFLIIRFGSELDKANWFGSYKTIDFSILEQFASSKTEIQENDPKLVLPKEFISLVGNQTLSSLRARNYLESRGITRKDIFKYRLGYCPLGQYSDRIIFPSFDCEGHINYFVARSYDREKRKYDNPDAKKKELIFNELYVDFNRPITLVEGVFDAVISGDNSIPLLGSIIRDDYLLLKRMVEHKTVVYSALDPDAAKKERRITQLLKSHGLRVRKIQVIPYRDVGEMTKEEFISRKLKSSLATDESYMVESLSGV